MKSDRRTLSVLVAILLGLIINQQFRSLFLFGAREATGQLTLNGSMLVTTQDENDTTNLGAWSLPQDPPQPDASRNQQVGYLLIKTARDWNKNADNKIDGITYLEKYCRSNPTDLAACAHMVRLSLNLSSLEKVRDKQQLTDQALRMAKFAEDGAKADPQNWYWRERQFHFYSILGNLKRASEAFTAEPIPTIYRDYVEDEVVCREALYAGAYRDLPKSGILPLWAEVIFPHYSSFGHFEAAAKALGTSEKFRLAELKFGEAMVHSGDTLIAALVGVRHIRFALWNTKKLNRNWKKYSNPSEEATMLAAYQKNGSKADFERIVKIAREEVSIHFFDVETDLTLLYVGQMGPIVITTGIFTAFFALVGWGASRSKLKSITLPLVGWITLLFGLFIPNAFWNSAHYLNHYSLGNQTLILVLFGLYGLNLWIMAKAGTVAKRWHYVLLLSIALIFGLLTPGLQASSILFFSMFAIQRGKMPLGSWTSAIGILGLCYQAAINLAFAPGNLLVLIGLVVGVAAILGMSQRRPEPDQPRLAALTFALGAVIIGTFLMAQYDRGVTTFFDLQKEEQAKLKERLAKL